MLIIIFLLSVVGCTKCESWTHLGCDNITRVIYQELVNPARADENYFCVKCRLQDPDLKPFSSADLMERWEGIK